MGIEEVAVFTAINQLSMAVAAYLKRTQAVPKSPYALAAIAVGIQLCNAVTLASQWGIAAAQAELATTQGAQATVVKQLQTLPSIT